MQLYLLLGTLLLISGAHSAPISSDLQVEIYRQQIIAVSNGARRITADKKNIAVMPEMTYDIGYEDRLIRFGCKKPPVGNYEFVEIPEKDMEKIRKVDRDNKEEAIRAAFGLSVIDNFIDPHYTRVGCAQCFDWHKVSCLVGPKYH